jgi:serine/threonine protein phosphatase 1
MASDPKFAILRPGGRCWAVAAIHGEAARLGALHGQLAPRIRPGDNLIYLGNMLGLGGAVAETVEEVLRFRRAFMARPGVFRDDVAYLRGSQEEIWHKLLQIQFATNPGEVLTWMMDQGVGATVAAYGGDPKDGFDATKRGAVALTDWTGKLRQAMSARDGHNALMSALRRAAYVADNSLLFVHAGIDVNRPLSEQTDSFWWGGNDYDAITAPYGAFRHVVRGFDPRHRGLKAKDVTITIDGGCGFGGPLLAVCFDATGRSVDTIEA